MNYILSILLLLGAFTANSQTTRVLIVGDSWAEQQWSDGIHDMVFADSGYPEYTSLGDDVAISGSTASAWTDANELQKITDALNANPSIDTVQLTIGGNDFLAQWNSSLSPMAVSAIQNQVTADLQIVVDHILAEKIGIEIILSFYDYPNFIESTTGFSSFECNSLHTQLGDPEPSVMNEAAVSFEQAFASLAIQNPKIFHVSHFGLMQNYVGFPDENIQPGDILPPGNLSLPSPIESMRPNGGNNDCIHLAAESYDVVVQNTYEQYFQYRFDTIFKSLFE